MAGATGTVYSDSTEHSIKCSVAASDSFTVEAQNMRSGEVWRGSFTQQYIENVTHKTGTYKQYPIFIQMLCDAISRPGDTVYIELLTYSDLVALKSRKQGSTKTAADSKRYLILTYKVKYESAHYPLPLQFAGKMCPVELQDNVTKLQKEIDRLKEQIVSVASPRKPAQHASCCRDNASLREEIHLMKSGKENGKKDPMIKNLQSALRNLENDMIREKNKYQRSLDKKSHECRQLVTEVENLRSENRSITVKLRSVTTELNLSKRNRLSNYVSNRSRSRTPDTRPNSRGRITPSDRRANSRPGSVDRSGGSLRSRGSAERSRGSAERSRGSAERRTRASVERSRGSSMERSTPYSRNNSNSRSSTRSAPEMRARARTPSPAGARLPRFDPSAYVKDRQQKLRERNGLRERQKKARTYIPRARSTPCERDNRDTSIYHKPPPSSIVKEIIKNNLLHGAPRSNSCSSLDSCGSKGSQNSRAGSQNSRARNVSRKKQKSRYSYPSSGSEIENKENKRRGSNYLNSPANVSNMSFTKDSEIAEIDARLNALQSYLKDAQNKQYVV